ncbi:MAG: ABC transporter substrate-binding protein [Pseudomonadota bacterium]
MKRTLVLTTALVAAGQALYAEELTVLSWGGAYTKSQVEAFHKPFTDASGIVVTAVDESSPPTTIKAQVEAGSVTVDVADVGFSAAISLCDEGLLEEIDHTILPPAPDGTPAAEDFIEGSLIECAVPNVVWSTVVAYNTEALDGTPTTITDFFDLDAYPGKRGMRKIARANLEMALMADGVPASEVYELLGTDEGVDRAFAKLDTIKDSVVWWEAGAQAPQLLADGEVSMSTAFNGRVFSGAVNEGQPFEVIWDGQVMDFDVFVIPKGAPNKDTALEYIAFATGTQPLADQAKWISYGPARKSSGPLVGLFQDGKTEMGPHMPTAAANLDNALVNNPEFWADHNSELNERFSAWLAQ